jgi:ElaB/YqjD/DUF883 family membrane-anchored ribosome-binding protein
MENGNGSSHETGFKAMSQNADTSGGSSTQNDDDDKAGIAANLKAYGVDTNQMTEVAGERASELQRLIMDEVKARPMRALGWAAAAGVIFGFWAAK